MNIRNNQHYKDTDRAICDALIRLLKKKDINRISIREICELAGIRRSTFYVHYENIFAVMDDIQKRLWDDQVIIFEEAPFSADSFAQKEGIELLLKYIYQNKDFYKVYLSLPNNEFLKTSAQHLWEYQKIGNMWNVTGKSEFDCAMTFFQAGFTSVVSKWLNNNCEEEISVLAAEISACVPSALKPR